VRHEVLPLLRTLNPRIEQALVRLSAAASNETDERDIVSAALGSVAAKNGAVRISRRALAALPERARASLVRSAIEGLLGDTRSIAERHVIAIVRSAATTGAQLDLPRGLRVEVQHEDVVLRAGHESVRVAPKQTRLAIPGSTRFGAFAVTTEVLAKPPARLKPASSIASVLMDAEVLGVRVWLRSRRPGDRYQALGRKRPKKLQDVLVDAHVPRTERDGLPLVCCRRGIAWVAGQPPAEWAKIGPGTKQALRIRAVLAEA
jgi:tRNA(Ile)-lysidine synthase